MYKAYLIAIILGIILTPWAVHAAYISRGCWAVGSEYLLPVLFVLIIYLATKKPLRNERSEVVKEIDLIDYNMNWREWK